LFALVELLYAMLDLRRPHHAQPDAIPDVAPQGLPVSHGRHAGRQAEITGLFGRQLPKKNRREQSVL
jgi:hypothetical protein